MKFKCYKTMMMMMMLALALLVSAGSFVAANQQLRRKKQSIIPVAASANKVGSSVVFRVLGNVYPIGYYYVEIAIGSRSNPYYLDIDTGSDLTWLHCDAPCKNCPKVTPRLEELQLFKQQQESRLVADSVPRRDDSPAKKPSQKRKTGTRQTEEQPTPKRQKGTVHNPMQAPETETEKAVGSTDSQNIKNDTINDKQIKHSANKELYKDQCTAFISNLNLQVNDEYLQNFLNDVDGVSAIRVLKDKYTGKSRGLAYVDFSNADKLSKALAKNKKILLGKKVSIARSNPQRNKNKGSSEKSTRELGDKRTRTTASNGTGESSGTLEDPKISTEQSKESGEPLPASATAVDNKQGDRLELKGKNTFAVPRNLARPLGWTKNVTKKEEANDEIPKSNDEFRKMLLKK